MKLWYLKDLNSGQHLIDPIPLPENWGPIFGMNGFREKLHDLSWIGMPNKGWFEVEVSDKEIELKEKKQLVDSQVEKLLNDSLYAVAADNLKFTKQQRAKWIEYRMLLNNIPNQSEYPLNVNWPKKPDIE
jgi:hypothetical protein